MVQKTIQVEVGSSETKVTGRTWLGVFAEDKSSINAVRRSVFNSGARKYLRNKTVWMCRECAAARAVGMKSKKGFSSMIVILGIIAVFILVGLTGSP